MPKRTRKKSQYQKANCTTNKATKIKFVFIEPDEETARILAQIETEYDYYHTCTNSQY